MKRIQAGRMQSDKMQKPKTDCGHEAIRFDKKLCLTFNELNNHHLLYNSGRSKLITDHDVTDYCKFAL
jgi:hypothetical protein